jgi:hypothetical protein
MFKWPPPIIFVATVLETSPGGNKPKSCLIVRDLMRTNRSRLFEIARVLVRFNHLADFIVHKMRLWP